jgi:transposase
MIQHPKRGERIMAGEFWLDDQQWLAIEPLLPKNQPGAPRDDDRRIISGIIHVLKSGCRWQDTPTAYGPPTTIYNRFRRWSIKGHWRRLFAALVELSPNDVQMIDSTTAKAHRSAAGGKGGRPNRRLGAHGVVGRQKSMPLSMVADDRSPSK